MGKLIKVLTKGISSLVKIIMYSLINIIVKTTIFIVITFYGVNYLISNYFSVNIDIGKVINPEMAFANPGILLTEVKNNLLKTPKPNNNKLKVVVKRVVDGDTFVANINGKDSKVRLIGVNTPESVKPGHPVEKFGKEASLFTKKMLIGKPVYLEFDIQTKDRYGRYLAYVYLPDGKMYNKILLDEGYARVMTIPPNVKYQKLFLAAERQARINKKGLWK